MYKFSISIIQWLSLIYGLRKRGKGIKESGAFLLVRPNTNKVCKIVFYDQFDKTVSDSGIIQFKGAINFFEFLARENLEVIADIHTHPSRNTNQSDSDQTHPMIRLKGHIAIIAPNFANNYLLIPSECSIYEYLGNFKWQKFDNLNNPIHIKFN